MKDNCSFLSICGSLLDIREMLFCSLLWMTTSSVAYFSSVRDPHCNTGRTNCSQVNMAWVVAVCKEKTVRQPKGFHQHNLPHYTCDGKNKTYSSSFTWFSGKETGRRRLSTWLLGAECSGLTFSVGGCKSWPPVLAACISVQFFFPLTLEEVALSGCQQYLSCIFVC